VLDGGAFGGVWHRTGQTFKVWSQPVGGALPACRFFSTSFAPKSSHFYTPSATECASLKSNPSWQYESIAFYLQLLDTTGACARRSTALFRLYNNGMGGAPNHRYTTSTVTFSDMQAAGWIFEGDGRTGVFACVPQQSAPEVDVWWNPNESGRWFFVESQNGIAQVGSFFYENDGRATWLGAGGANADPYSYSGRLLAYRNGQTLFGDYVPPTAPTDAGAVSVSFSDDTHGAITWPGGTIPLERQRFGSATAPFQPDSGWWWNPDESGTDYSIELQGDSIVVLASMYDGSGNPIWYYSAGKMASPATYQGPWLQFANGQTLTGPYHSPTAPVSVGQLAVEFTAIDQATLTFTDDVTAAVAGSNLKRIKPRLVNIKRKQPVKPQPINTLPARYDGRFTLKTIFDATTSGIRLKILTTVTGALTWVDGPAPELESLIRHPASSYVLSVSANTKAVVLTYDEQLDGAGGHCKGNLTDSYALSDNGSFLEVNGYGEYNGRIELNALSGSITITCIYDDGGSLSYDIPLMVPVQMDMHGISLVYGINGEQLPHPSPSLEGATISGDWSFAAVTK
jgi:hypothetical protein